MENIIYLDNNATTKCDDEVLNSMLPYLKDNYGNPNSSYYFGRDIREKINEARKNIAKLINAEDGEIIFTSCASESNATAIMSAVKSYPNKKHILTTSVEHASILENMKYLTTIGYDITYLSVNEKGQINLNELESYIKKDTLLISIMMANNEIGNIYPIKEISKISRKHDVIFHTDAVQAVSKIKIDAKDLDVDMLSISGHKIHAPKGIGVLYIKSGTQLNPLIYGHQEKNRRGGTENAAYIIGIGKAAQLIIEDDYKSSKQIEKLRNGMEERIKNTINDIFIYGDVENRLPNTSNIAFGGVRGDELLLMLESYDVFVSTGSACNSENLEPSHVLKACNADLTNFSPIRISLSKYNTFEEINVFIEKLSNAVSTIRRKNSKNL